MRVGRRVVCIGVLGVARHTELLAIKEDGTRFDARACSIFVRLSAMIIVDSMLREKK